VSIFSWIKTIIDEAQAQARPYSMYIIVCDTLKYNTKCNVTVQLMYIIQLLS